MDDNQALIMICKLLCLLIKAIVFPRRHSFLMEEVDVIEDKINRLL